MCKTFMKACMGCDSFDHFHLFWMIVNFPLLVTTITTSLYYITLWTHIFGGKEFYPIIYFALVGFMATTVGINRVHLYAFLYFGICTGVTWGCIASQASLSCSFLFVKEKRVSSFQRDSSSICIFVPLFWRRSKRPKRDLLWLRLHLNITPL